jgi:hypothetical protein
MQKAGTTARVRESTWAPRFHSPDGFHRPPSSPPSSGR